MNFLETIIAVKEQEVEELNQLFSVASFNDFEFYKQAPLSFSSALIKADAIAVIAEIKKASPSKGVLREDFNHLKIAKTYFENRVDAISILTDEIFFQGSINFLKDIAGIKTAPLLRKDFIIDEMQIHQAKAFGADAILLICEALDKTAITELTLCANEIGLDVLLEMHSAKQLEKIDQSINKIIGVNNRNLETFEVNLNTSINLRQNFNEETIFVSESGITTQRDILELKQINVNAVLAGEHFMKQENISSAIHEFQNWCRYEN
ncbi:MAG: indole-3-glycerol phosphate synthase TrpC [Ignavibacteria bacterium]|nr:indole-3-glycerol phosphate synthase TrpC [Ignavibacteria bacterium]